MAGGAPQPNGNGAEAKAVRIPSLPGRQQFGREPQVDTECDAYKAGCAAASAELRGEMAQQEARHEEFVKSVGDMLGNHVPPGNCNVKTSESAQTGSDSIEQTLNLCRPVQGGLPQSNRSSMTISASAGTFKGTVLQSTSSTRLPRSIPAN